MYSSFKDLPEGIKANLPKKAQKLYMGVFNDTWENCSKKEADDCGYSRYKFAHVKAWSAVKQKFERSGDSIWREIR
ncbi:cation transport regulator ChaB [Candidatus Saccharibacteria bacterium CPR2]|nr:cation transport regulator ChaB [Candidatus Saccharibacteria bacterium CPR2]